jgi:hypothetical protein
MSSAASSTSTSSLPDQAGLPHPATRTPSRQPLRRTQWVEIKEATAGALTRPRAPVSATYRKLYRAPEYLGSSS